MHSREMAMLRATLPGVDSQLVSAQAVAMAEAAFFYGTARSSRLARRSFNKDRQAARLSRLPEASAAPRAFPERWQLQQTHDRQRLHQVPLLPGAIRSPSEGNDGMRRGSVRARRRCASVRTPDQFTASQPSRNRRWLELDRRQSLTPPNSRTGHPPSAGRERHGRP